MEFFFLFQLLFLVILQKPIFPSGMFVYMSHMEIFHCVKGKSNKRKVPEE